MDRISTDRGPIKTVIQVGRWFKYVKQEWKVFYLLVGLGEETKSITYSKWNLKITLVYLMKFFILYEKKKRVSRTKYLYIFFCFWMIFCRIFFVEQFFFVGRRGSVCKHVKSCMGNIVSQHFTLTTILNKNKNIQLLIHF